MLKKRLFGMITLMVGVMLVFTLMGCSSGGGGGIIRPNIFKGYHGITSLGKFIEMIFDDETDLTSDYSGKEYVVKIDGAERSKGTATKTGTTIKFTSSDGSTISDVTLDGSGVPTNLSITKANDGQAYTAIYMAISSDYFYAIGGPTSQSETQIREGYLTANTPSKIKNYLQINLNDYDVDEGTFDEITEFGKSYKCPDEELSRISEEMNSGKFYGVGYYKHKEYGNIVYCVSKLPFSSY
jgi:hypothetical protein